MKKIGILGGSFDPFHNGHLAIGNAALEECGLDKIILLPTNVQPFKIGQERASNEHRINMTNLIAHENKNFVVSTVEAESSEISYTYNTMQHLSAEFPNCELCFIVGTDSFLGLESWYRHEELLSEGSFIIGIRPGYKETETENKAAYYRDKYNTKIQILHNQILQISSTEIKQNIKNGESINLLVPDSIERYIYEHKLYK